MQVLWFLDIGANAAELWPGPCFFSIITAGLAKREGGMSLVPCSGT